MVTTKDIFRYACWLAEIDPGFLALVLSMETGEDYRDRDIMDQVSKLIEIFGIGWRGANCRVPELTN